MQAIGGRRITMLSENDKTRCLTSAQYHVNLETNYIPICQRKPVQLNRVYDIDSISPTLGSSHGSYEKRILENNRIRRLTPTECARLQTIPEWYKWECSATQQYKMLGNGWTVDVIAHILSYMKLNEIE